MREEFTPPPRIVSRPSLLEFLQRDITLDKRLNLYYGDCPECSPTYDGTLVISEGDEMFHCYRCNLNGDIFTWIQVTRGLSFREAFDWVIRYSAARYPMSEN